MKFQDEYADTDSSFLQILQKGSEAVDLPESQVNLESMNVGYHKIDLKR